MMAHRMKWLLVGVAGIVLFTWVTLAVQQQVKKIDDKALKNARKGTEWLSYGMDWSEQRYSTMTQITPENVGKLALAWSYEVGPGGGARRRLRSIPTASSIPSPTGASSSQSMRRPARKSGAIDPQADRTMNAAGRIAALLRRQQPRHRAV